MSITELIMLAGLFANILLILRTNSVNNNFQIHLENRLTKIESFIEHLKTHDGAVL